jgi:hypothetical protein
LSFLNTYLFINRRIIPNSIKIVIGRRQRARNKIYIKSSYEGPTRIGSAFTNGETKKNKVIDIIESFT